MSGKAQNPKAENVGKAEKQKDAPQANIASEPKQAAKQPSPEAAKLKVPEEYIQMVKNAGQKGLEIGQAAITTAMTQAKALLKNMKK